jgi:hypothetical protein
MTTPHFLRSVSRKRRSPLEEAGGAASWFASAMTSILRLWPEALARRLARSTIRRSRDWELTAWLEDLHHRAHCHGSRLEQPFQWASLTTPQDLPPILLPPHRKTRPGTPGNGRFEVVIPNSGVVWAVDSEDPPSPLDSFGGELEGDKAERWSSSVGPRTAVLGGGRGCDFGLELGYARKTKGGIYKIRRNDF